MTYFQLEVADVYETVDDDEYEQIVAKRQHENFVVDDGTNFDNLVK